MKGNCLKGCFCSKEGAVINKIIPELVSGSSTHAVEKQQASKTLKKFQGLSNFITEHGFTLIELLVVVLIIGILTAIAVPQYQMAVAKSRAVEALAAVKAIREAQMRYHLANGTFASDVAELDVDFPGLKKGRSGWISPHAFCYVRDVTVDLAYCDLYDSSKQTILQWSLPLTWNGTGHCYVRSNPIGDKVCSSLTGVKQPYENENGALHNFSFEI